MAEAKVEATESAEIECAPVVPIDRNVSTGENDNKPVADVYKREYHSGLTTRESIDLDLVELDPGPKGGEDLNMSATRAWAYWNSAELVAAERAVQAMNRVVVAAWAARAGDKGGTREECELWRRIITYCGFAAERALKSRAYLRLRMQFRPEQLEKGVALGLGETAAGTREVVPVAACARVVDGDPVAWIRGRAEARSLQLCDTVWSEHDESVIALDVAKELGWIEAREGEVLTLSIEVLGVRCMAKVWVVKQPAHALSIGKQLEREFKRQGLQRGRSGERVDQQVVADGRVVDGGVEFGAGEQLDWGQDVS